jgi:SHS2 domain-containing protein
MPGGSFEILEHTADVGIRATGATPAEVFEQAALGLADIIGIRTTGPGEVVEIALDGSDRGGLLVDFLSEILWLHESRSAALASVTVDEASNSRVGGRVVLTPLKTALGTQVKAITYHQLRVEQEAGGWTATVFVDV